MATYDLAQQEELDNVKHLWTKYGSLISWTLVVVLLAFAGWTGYKYWQQQRGVAAGGLYEELDKAAATGDVDKAVKAFNDLKDGYAGTTYAQQGALLVAKVQAGSDKADEAGANLQWLIDSGNNKDLVAVARLRQAGLLLDAGKHDEALKVLDDSVPESFQALVNDRRGDILVVQDKRDEAVKAYQSAWKAMSPQVDYRRFIEIKLTALGVAPEAKSASDKSVQATSDASAP